MRYCFDCPARSPVVVAIRLALKNEALGSGAERCMGRCADAAAAGGRLRRRARAANPGRPRPSTTPSSSHSTCLQSPSHMAAPVQPALSWAELSQRTAAAPARQTPDWHDHGSFPHPQLIHAPPSSGTCAPAPCLFVQTLAPLLSLLRERRAGCPERGVAAGGPRARRAAAQLSRAGGTGRAAKQLPPSCRHLELTRRDR